MITRALESVTERNVLKEAKLVLSSHIIEQLVNEFVMSDTDFMSHLPTNGTQAVTESDSLSFPVGPEEVSVLFLVVVMDAFVRKVAIEGQTNCFKLSALTFVLAY